MNCWSAPFEYRLKLSAGQRRAVGASSPEMALREGPAGAGLQVALELDRDGLVCELQRDHQLPGLEAGRVRGSAGVVCGEAHSDVGSQANVGSLRLVTLRSKYTKRLFPCIAQRRCKPGAAGRSAQFGANMNVRCRMVAVSSPEGESGHCSSSPRDAGSNEDGYEGWLATRPPSQLRCYGGHPSPVSMRARWSVAQ